MDTGTKGLGAAMAESGVRGRIIQLERDLARLERQVLDLTNSVQRLSEREDKILDITDKIIKRLPPIEPQEQDG